MSDELRLLEGEISGEVITSADPAFEQHNDVFYLEFGERRPLAVARVADASDVSKVVGFARDTGTELAVRAGGHSMLGHSTTEGGLVLDLSKLKSLDVDVEARSAWAGTGLLAGEYTSRVTKHGLVTGFGDTPTVGISGLTLGGGIGFLHRKLGMTVDSVLGAEIVTADGQVRHIDSESEPDLFWAIRGGGGNFGVVTRIHYRLHPIDTVLGGMLILPATSAVIAHFVEAAQDASDDLSVIAGIAVAPPLPFLPEHVHGELVVLGLMVHAGDSEVARAEVGRFRKLTTPLVDGIQEMRYTGMFEAEEGPPQAVAVSGRSILSDAFTRDEADAVIAALRTSTGDMSVVQVRVLGGEVARVPVDATAFAHRDRAMIVNVVTAYQEPRTRDEHEAWVDGLKDQIRVGAPGAYVNFNANESPGALREIYPGATWNRLVDVKTKYDQDNLFKSNHNIPPRA